MTFNRRVNARTPGPFRTKVVTQGVDPQLSCYDKSSRLKQHFKEHPALRTETLSCDARDFGIGRTPGYPPPPWPPPETSN